MALNIHTHVLMLRLRMTFDLRYTFMAPVSVTFQVASFRQGSEAADLGSLLCFLINLKGCQEPLVATAPAENRSRAPCQLWYVIFRFSPRVPNVMGL